MDNDRICRVCGERGKRYYKPDSRKVCVDCMLARQRELWPSRRERQRKYREENPDIFRKAMLKHRYGLSVEERDKLLLEQENRCGICKEIKPLGVDHDHSDQRVRGLLCRGCNLLLGYAKDDPVVLASAIEWLRSG